MTTVVIGIDGATFKLFEDWLSDLPTLSSIIETGISTPLDSCLPPVTSPAWRCYATGKNPASLGVYWWRQFHRDKKTIHGADEYPLQSKCFWESLSEQGQKVGVVGVPLNAPPREVNGALVSGGPFANPDNYTYPDSLSEEIEEQFEYRLHPTKYPSVSNAKDPKIIADFSELIDQRFDVAEWLREKYDPDLLNLTLFYINTLQHKAWRCQEVKQLWEQVDQRIGKLISDEDNVIIHSDHGLHEVDRVFYINGWLREHGDLVIRDIDRSSGIRSKMVGFGELILSQVGLKSAVASNIPALVESTLGLDSRRLIDSTEYESRIDFDNSKAIAFPQGPVYILIDDKSYQNELQQELEAVTDPNTNKPIFSAVQSAEEVYGKPLPVDAPDLLVQWNEGYEIKDVHHSDENKVFGPPHGVVADNAQAGILIAAGPDIGTTRPPAAKLHDLAPTLLHLHGAPVPDDIDGTVLSNLYAPGSVPANTPVETVSQSLFNKREGQEDATQNVESRLQDLGYLE